MPPANRTGDQFDTLVVVRHKPVLEDSLKPSRLCRVSGRNGGQSTVRLTERHRRNGSAAHRHPGTVAYILEGTYEVKINDGPVQTLKSGEVFYEPPNALHAISRNARMELPLKYLVIQVSAPTKPATVPERGDASTR